MTPAESSRRGSYQPPERMTVWQWAEQHLVMPPPYPGLYRSELTPYARGPMEAFRQSQKITLCFGTQSGKTTIMFACIGYVIDQDPGDMMLIYPTGDVAKRVSKKRLQRIINISPDLAKHKTEKEDDFQLMAYTLDAMSVVIVGSNSPAAISSDPIRYLIRDEVDKFAMETSREADSLSLSEERTKAVWNAVVMDCSTPTTSEGPIWHSFQQSDRRYYHVPCPHCGAYQTLVFDNIRWPDLKSVRIRDLDTLGWYECASCNGAIRDKHKPEMLLAGRWIAEDPEARWPGFHLNSLYPRWKSSSFGAIAAKWLRSRRYPDQKRNFINSWLALPYDPEEEGSDVVSDTALAAAANSYRYHRNTVPVEHAILTMGADVHKEEKGLYYVVYAWGRVDNILHAWLIAWGIAVDFRHLLDAYESEFTCSIGPGSFRPSVCGIDSRYRTNEVYEFCKTRRGLLPVKGMRVTKDETGSVPWKDHPIDKAIKGGQRYYALNTTYWKEFVYSRINQAADENEPTIFHLPDDVEDEFLRQIASEREVKRRNDRGQWERFFVTKKGIEANHYLDATAYACAVADIARVPYMREFPAASTATPEPAPPKQAAPRRHENGERSGWLGKQEGWLRR